MEIIGALASLLKAFATFAPTIVARIEANDAKTRDYFKNASDSVQDADELVEIGKQVASEEKAADAEYKKRGL